MDILLKAARIALAWEIYCRETSGSMDIRDFWNELPEYVQHIFLKKADELIAEQVSSARM